MTRISYISTACLTLALLASCGGEKAQHKAPVDYVNPYMGNISHLLVPTFPTVHLPNSLLRVYPERSDYTSERVTGLPIAVTHHRERSAFNLTPFAQAPTQPTAQYNYDNEVLRPYYFSIELDDNSILAQYAPSHQSAVYNISFSNSQAPYLCLNSRQGEVSIEDGTVKACQLLDNDTRLYVYLETQEAPTETAILANGNLDSQASAAQGQNVAAVLRFAEPNIHARYGISLISAEQAKKNLEREIQSYDVNAVAEAGRQEWNDALGRIAVEGEDEESKTVFYTSYYRTMERPICLSEDGQYYSAYDHAVHADGGTPFYTDDWIWDTYRGVHPLRTIIEPEKEEQILYSFLEMADQMGTGWMPTFPELTGDSRRMNSNHAVASVADAVAKGLKIDTLRAYEACRKGIEEKTLAPWNDKRAGWIDQFYVEHGYIPALKDGETENDPNINPSEQRQPVAVTLGTSYDQWCLSRIAAALNRPDEADYYYRCSHNYRNIYNPATAFFHPKDKDGRWIEPFDYRFSGGQGARRYYGENNGWVYRWDVPHNIPDLIGLMGGAEQFVANLDQTFSEPLGKSKYEFYSQLPDQTGNVGQFSMANEPSMHVPYLYDYAGQPWKTQKRVRQMLQTWFRNDLMGLPGDEDGGGLSAFVVFSSLGFYPVTPGEARYAIGSPVFDEASITLPSGGKFTVIAHGASQGMKYIQSATLNGEPFNQPWIYHSDIAADGTLVFQMGYEPNKQWGVVEMPDRMAMAD
ncbi:MAG: GH92 family glycosyl hydrolase [Bacteroidales bacterium]|nr:GH92 family glycosyl hydrolase [Bacteroidales bacterium]